MSLTAKQEAFAAACAKGATASDAYRVAYRAGRMATKTVHEEAARLLAIPKVTARVEELRKGAVQAVQLEVEEVFRQLVGVLRSDPARVFDRSGRPLPIHKIDDTTRGAISSIEMGSEVVGRGKNARVETFVKKVRFWSKTEAIDKAMKALGLFERDNRQRGENLALQINLVGVPQEARGEVEVVANLVKPIEN